MDSAYSALRTSAYRDPLIRAVLGRHLLRAVKGDQIEVPLLHRETLATSFSARALISFIAALM